MNTKKIEKREIFIVSKNGVRHCVIEKTSRTSIQAVEGMEKWSNPYVTYHLSNGTEIKKGSDGTFKIPGTDDTFTIER